MNMKQSFLVLLLGGGIIFLLVDHITEKHSDALSESKDHYNRFGLILDTPGCHVPKLDPYDESVRSLIIEKEPYVCDGMPVFLIIRPNSTVILNETVLRSSYKVAPESVSCFYRVIHREHEPHGYIGENTISFGDKKVLKFGVPLGEEFLRVDCVVGGENFTQYVGLVPIKPGIEKTKNKKRNGTNLNVVLIGIDSVSKLNFLRHFKRTHKFLTSNLSAFDMKGYTKVGDNTFPNLTPMLTGHFIEHYWNESIRNTFFFDGLDFLWKQFSAKGYRTFYAEDGVYTGTFNYLKRGFRDPPTDYYSRALGLAMADSELKKKGNGYCLNDQLEMDIFLGYLRSFLETMESRPSFSFTMVSSLTHDYLNEAGYADEPTYNTLKTLYDLGMMNNSLVVVFSDHGIRFGAIRETYIGKFEERMPFMYLTLPRWFLDENADIAKSLKTNQNRLTTPFDIHATLYHLLKLPEHISDLEKHTATPNGQSLMRDISEYRTCEMANIMPHWCPCQVFQYISPNDKTAVMVAVAVIDNINKQLHPLKDKCAGLKLDRITDARLRQANDMVLRFVKHQNDVINRLLVYGDKQNVLTDFLVTVRAQPGGGMFEGTVRYNDKDKKMTVLGISRINRYGKQSSCIDRQKFKKFCFCK